ncbi:nucleotidyltransferase domain-containing protein [Anaerocolumna sp. MB42-C2]|uniref:nucleotidyltransferase domain-containing protein n=1 Tax=Anaerocolumna sp. MB42-C2 TaxID=3070997 RepID=UPI0027E2020E|nr:hypothetical protein [Anaerocolumna sp. MB42-C2]WMJ90550.1 hypothetical protein RBU59_13750 [Anaerocolumna sp. MB42-C2]
MVISKKNQQYITMLADIYDISSSLGIRTFVWGGLSIDIWEGYFLREHGDLDGFVENLTEYVESLTSEYVKRGYKVTFHSEFLMLEVEKDLVHASFNPLKRNGKTAEWKHIGNDGSVFFPFDWLDVSPRLFYNTKVYTSGIRFEYAVKTKVSMLHPEWRLREKDQLAIKYMEEKLKAENICKEDIYKWFWSYNPYWYKQGYDEFFRPTIAYPIQPK